MAEKRARPTLLQGTLDLLILRTLALGPLHGHGIVKHIQRTSKDVLHVEHALGIEESWRREVAWAMTRLLKPV